MTRKYRKQQQRKAALQGAAMLAGIVATIAFSMWMFPRVDCHTARKGLDFIERCEADENCTLRAHELDLKKAYTRLEIKSCPKD